MGDRFLLHRALTNLVQNALDFAPAASAVGVGARRLGNEIEFRVEDADPGIPPYAYERVFERFYSLPRPDVHRKGTGLGLAFVKEIAELHRGSIVLDPGREGGLTARLRVPAAAEPSAARGSSDSGA